MNRRVSFQDENFGWIADWFTEEPTSPAQTSRTTPGIVDEVEENNSLDEGPAVPTTKPEDVLPTGEMENEIVPFVRGKMHKAIGDEVTSENMWERQEVLAGENNI